MKKISFDELKDEKKDFYSFLWGEKEFNFNIVLTGNSDKSYEFDFAGRSSLNYVGESLAKNFGIYDEKTKETFLAKFAMVCSGTGDELKKITTLHSSSLCALLFFFNVSREKPLFIKGYENYKFTQSVFEFKNKVIGYPSNIDVVLLGKNMDSGDNVILFLESKFSEYITGINKKDSNYEIGESYFYKKCYSEPIYRHLFKKNIVHYRKSKNKSYLYADLDKYIEGLKQIISHYYGIRNFLNNDFYVTDNDSLETLKQHKAKEFLLGEILFDNFGDKFQERLQSYEKDYCELASIINLQCQNDKIKNFRILEKSLRYSTLLNDMLDFPQIHDFYIGTKI